LSRDHQEENLEPADSKVKIGKPIWHVVSSCSGKIESEEHKGKGSPTLAGFCFCR
jgi:hypothetical protein